METAKVDVIIEKYNGEASSLLAIMQDVQDEANYLPREAVEYISKKLDVPVARIYSMATFYESFHLEPRGKNICTVCMGTACHVRGAERLVEQLERDLDVSSGGTTKDGLFSIEEVNCVGACALGPLLIVNGEYHGNQTTNSVSKLIKKMKKNEGGE
ncbi:MAG: NAD(P)H-dependent oxidoreductase subunit E [Deltaproteobacteria bacterium]|nr:NAD(P)H-dependent oxidoreductase subunit E [Deltaproteobacteria bacterium]MBN2671193.1 NAD(P)H-dependent oxidoreductase subunit E [Deltaproteobacteria bacterium]